MTASASVRARDDESPDRSDSGGGGGGGIAHRRLILCAIAVVLVGATVIWLVGFSAVFGVRTVTVRGVHNVSATQVRAAAHLTRGAPLVRLDTDGIAKRVEVLPDVASATVATSYPSTVIITVSERVAIGVVRVGGGYMLVDRTGDQFRGVTQRPARLPLFVVPQGTDARTTGGAVATVAAALPSTVRRHVASIQALDPEAITLLLKNDHVVQWGSATRNAAKARVLAALLRQPGTQFDVSDPDQPFSR